MSSPAKAATWQAFESKYLANADPWYFASSEYEQRRYTIIMEALKNHHFKCAYEPGCSVGVLTQRLAQVADRVFAIDFAPSAVDQAKLRCADLPMVQIEVADISTYLAPQVPDLIILSEIGYYFPHVELKELACFLAQQLAPRGVLLAAHWLGSSPDHELHGNDVHELLRSTLPLTWLHGSRHEGFRVDCWCKP